MNWWVALNEDDPRYAPWWVMRDGERMVSLDDYEKAQGIVDRINAAGLERGGTE